MQQFIYQLLLRLIIYFKNTRIAKYKLNKINISEKFSTCFTKHIVTNIFDMKQHNIHSQIIYIQYIIQSHLIYLSIYLSSTHFFFFTNSLSRLLSLYISACNILNYITKFRLNYEHKPQIILNIFLSRKI